MKLLFLTNGFPPRHTAGTENYTAGVAHALAQAGHQVQVICIGDWDRGSQPLNGLTQTEDPGDGVVVTRLDVNWQAGPDPNRYLYDNPLIAAQVAALLDAARPDLVHITSCATLSASVIRTVAARRLPLIVTLTDFWFICPRITLLHASGAVCSGRKTPWQCLTCLLWHEKAYRLPSRVLPAPLLRPLLTWCSRQPWLSRLRGLRGLALDMANRQATLPPLLAQADCLISPSHFLAAVHQSCGVRAPFQIVEHGHDLGWTAHLTPRPAHQRPLVIGFVGQIAPVKGVHILIEAAARLPDPGAVRIEIWGDLDKIPAYRAQLQALAAPLPHIEFRGRFERAQIAAVFSRFTALAVPSLWYENNPLVIQEAFAAGVPVIASAQGGMAEFVAHERSGLLFAPGQPAALAAAIQRLQQEPDLLPRLRRGLPAVKTVEAEVQELLAIYQRVRQQKA